MADKFWKNVSVDVQSALGTAQTISNITQANPGSVVHTGAAVTEGAYLLFSVTGMTKLNDRVVRADNVEASPTQFETEEIDTSNYSTFVSGSFQAITFGTSLTTITGITSSGGDPEYEDISLIHSDIRSEAPTVKTPFSIDMVSKWDPSDASLLALQTASETNAQRAVRITFSDNSRIAFYGFVSCTLIPTGDFPNLARTAISFRASGLNTALST